jgi:uncharacterized protein
MTEIVPVTISLPYLVQGDDGEPEYYIVLREADGERRLFIGVGKAEAAALSFGVQGTAFPRPMTYQFAAALLAGSGSGLREVHITNLADGVFYAQAVLANGAVVDARPSDAVNLAAVTRAPVFVASELLDLPIGPRQPAAT